MPEIELSERAKRAAVRRLKESLAKLAEPEREAAAGILDALGDLPTDRARLALACASLMVMPAARAAWWVEMILNDRSWS